MGERDEADRWALAASERKRREREGDETLTGGAGWAVFGPAEGGGGSFSFSFLFLILIPFFSFFYFCFFLFLFPLNPKIFSK